MYIYNAGRLRSVGAEVAASSSRPESYRVPAYPDFFSRSREVSGVGGPARTLRRECREAIPRTVEVRKRRTGEGWREVESESAVGTQNAKIRRKEGIRVSSFCLSKSTNFHYFHDTFISNQQFDAIEISVFGVIKKNLKNQTSQRCQKKIG